jgi:2-oxoglutarate ferredoxin oxidoreductase subunit gamma
MKKKAQSEKETGKVRIVIGGSGGQGILTIGKALAAAAIKQKLEVSCLPSYGAEMRGGYVYCTIVMSESREIYSPISAELDIGLFMNDSSYKMLASYLKKNAYVLLNSSLVKNCQKKNFRTFEIEATEIAEQLGNIKNANLILAGALGNLISRNFLKFNISSLYSGVTEIMSDKKMSEQGRRIIKAGWELIGNGRCQEKD